MEVIDLQKHYLTFKWAVSKNWKDKNGLHKSIQYKMEIITQEYNLSERDIVDDLFANYWERGHYLKYDESKGSLNNWIARYVNLYLNHEIRRQAVRQRDAHNQRIDPADQRNWSNITCLNRDNKREDPDYQPDMVLDTTNAEDLLIAKETMQFVSDHFSKPEIAYLMGEMDLPHAAEHAGISCDAFRKRLHRRKADFKHAMKMADQ